MFPGQLTVNWYVAQTLHDTELFNMFHKYFHLLFSFLLLLFVSNHIIHNININFVFILPRAKRMRMRNSPTLLHERKMKLSLLYIKALLVALLPRKLC